MRTPSVLIAFVVAFAAPYADAAERPIVLELFTSEGCSSCPPAEELLSRLASRKDLLALSFHVTYWNSLGWRDPFSFEGATERQAAYATRLGGGSYTPEMVVDGRKGMVGSENVEVADAIVTAKRAAAAAAKVSLARTLRSISISIGKGSGHGAIVLVGYDLRHRTKIGRGENRGLTLVESNVVRSLRRVGEYVGDPIEISVPPGPGSEVAVLVQAPDGRIIAAGRD